MALHSNLDSTGMLLKYVIQRNRKDMQNFSWGNHEKFSTVPAPIKAADTIQKYVLRPQITT